MTKLKDPHVSRDGLGHSMGPVAWTEKYPQPVLSESPTERPINTEADLEGRLRFLPTKGQGGYEPYYTPLPCRIKHNSRGGV